MTKKRRRASDPDWADLRERLKVQVFCGIVGRLTLRQVSKGMDKEIKRWQKLNNVDAYVRKLLREASPVKAPRQTGRLR